MDKMDILMDKVFCDVTLEFSNKFTLLPIIGKLQCKAYSGAHTHIKARYSCILG